MAVTVRTAPAVRSRIVVPVLLTLAALVVLVLVGASQYTDLLFYRQVGFSSVFDTALRTKLVLFAVFGSVLGAAVGANIVVAYRMRPRFRPASPEQHSLEAYRVAVEPYRVALLVVVCALFAVFSGLAAVGQWKTVLLWLHGQRVGLPDPQFHRDIGYYMFTYPFERMVLGFLFAAVLLGLVVTLLMHYLFGGIRSQGPGQRVTAAAKAHVSVLLGLFVLLKAVAYYLDRFGLDFSPRGRVTGAGYTDVHATLPAKTILLVIAVLCAVLFFANIWRRGFALPGIGLGLLILSAVVIGGIYPAIVQQFTVKPNEINLESPYIQRNIDGTQRAYGLVPASRGGTVRYTNYPATSTPSLAQVRAATSSIPHTRLLDPNQLQPTFQQLQQNRAYYTFPPTLGVDRYTVNGKTEVYDVAVRDVNLPGLRPDQQNWPNEHLIYTHGIGFVAAAANTVDAQGRPVFTDGNIPPAGPNGGPPLIPISQPRVYYGLNSPGYSIVHTGQQEIDGPQTGDYTYTGTGGVSIGSQWRRLLFALRFKDRNILLSSSLTSRSRIMYYRNPRERVQKVAPWLTLDGDPYPAVVHGRITWILDGYTTSDMYPYSQRTSLGAATADTTTTTGGVTAQAATDVNYIRNSVKATVDAFSGAVTLYAFDPTDPVLRTWMTIFPGTVRSMARMDSALRAHLRYPEDLFAVQRNLMTRYHISDAQTFYRGNDFWSVPSDPSNKNQTPQPPYYQYLQAPGQRGPAFDLTSTMVASNRPNLAAFVSVSSDPRDYGVMRVLQLPTGTAVLGPANVATTIENNRVVSSTLTPLRLGGSSTLSGNLLTIPVAGGLLFVEPIYVQANGTSQTFPTLQEVAAVYGGNVGFGSSLATALEQVLGAAPPGTQGLHTAPAAAGPVGGSAGSAGSTPVAATVATLVAQAQTDYAAAQAALRAGDFAGYGTDTAQLQHDLARLAAVTAGSPATLPSSRPSTRPSARSSPGPSAG